MKTLLTSLGMVAALVACADATPFARYQTIIDRKPFGPEPVNFDPEAAPGSATAQSAQADGEMTPEQRTAEEQQLAASVRVSMINVRPSGDVAVGFTDTGANPQANYYLTVGRSQDGWTVKSADPATESVTLAKDGIEVTMKLGENAGGKGGKGGNAANAPRRMMAPRMFQGAAEGRGPGSMPPGVAGADGNESMPPRGALGGLARLRQQRQEQMARAAEEAQRKREADDAAKAERQEREAREAEERQREAEQKQREAEERAQQREALLQIQEQLKRAREEREAAKREQQEGQGEANDPE